jgi:hypothetical protein
MVGRKKAKGKREKGKRTRDKPQGPKKVGKGMS